MPTPSVLTLLDPRSQPIPQAVSALIELIADPPEGLTSSGFQLVTIPIRDAAAATDAPLADGEIFRVYLTDYPEPRRLLELGPDDSSGAGVLEVSVKEVASGADSEYLPECYKPLFARSASDDIAGSEL